MDVQSNQDVLRYGPKGPIARVESATATAKESFLNCLNRNATGGCWEWKYGKKSTQKGRDYGVAHFGGKKWSTHRIAWVLAFGPIPKGLFVCHKCDNPPCCNPDHLFLGTIADNTHDCISKGRMVKPQGENHYNALLTEEKVLQIRKRYKHRSPNNSLTALAREFGVGTAIVWEIIKRRKWKHVA